MKAMALVAAAALAGLAMLLGGPGFMEAWLPVFLLGSGLVAGALGALLLGHLLDDAWLHPVRPALVAAARTAPLVALLALPVLTAPEWLYAWAGPGAAGLDGSQAAWFSSGAFRLRAALILTIYVLLAWWAVRPDAHPLRTAMGLAVLVPAATLAAQDWALSRDVAWFGSLQGTALFIEQVMAALAGAVLITLLRQGQPEREASAGLERALLTLALVTLWLWFVQFVVVWMADLPAESGWYLRRGGPWLWLKAGVILPALVAAIIIAIPPRSGPWRLGAVCALLLIQHLGHQWWLVRPEAPHGAASLWLDGLVVPVLAAAWAGWWWSELRRAASA